jgi:hypothetical protein
LYYDGSLKWLAIHSAAKLLGTVNLGVLESSICILHDVMEITRVEPFQKSRLNYELLRAHICHCQVAEFLLHSFKNMLKA